MTMRTNVCYVGKLITSEQLTPSEEQQILLILQGQCPHNGGWHDTTSLWGDVLDDLDSIPIAEIWICNKCGTVHFELSKEQFEKENNGRNK